jgi:hypothetical protein
MFQLFSNTFIVPSEKRIKCCGSSPEKVDLAYLVSCAKQSGTLTIEHVSKLDFVTLVLDYYTELYPAAPVSAIEKLYSLTMSRASLLPMAMSDLKSIDFPAFPSERYIGQRLNRGLIDAELRKIVPLEYLLADFLNNGTHTATFLADFKVFLFNCLRQTINEIRQEILYKVYHIHRLAPDLDRTVPLHKALASHPKLRFLVQSNYFYPREVQELYDEFVFLYQQGYGIASLDHTMQSKFLSIVLEATESSDVSKFIHEDVVRPFSIFFSTNTFTERNNPFIVDYFYELKRTNDLSLNHYIL